MPFELDVEAQENESLLSIAQKAGLTDVQCCGMNPLCGKCKVSVLEGEGGLSPIRSKELEYCRENGFLPYQRLGCLARVLNVQEIWIELERQLVGGREQCQKANLES